jgi:mannose-6-phosphate isomerase
MLKPFKLIPTYRDYVWGGKRLRPEAEITAEAWVVYTEDIIADGDYAGQTLGQVAELEGEALLGARVLAQTGKRFPLLIKLLDCNKWLSLQVHPNDEQARQLAGPEFFGKTEAWYVIDAEKEAQLISGFRPGVTQAQIQAAVGKKELLDLVERREVQAGDSIFIAPGTIHALGSGLLIYEVQQSSDLTYRVYDWDRPMTSGRKLHIEESKICLNPAEHGNVVHADAVSRSKSRNKLISCPFFTLELLSGSPESASTNIKLDSFSAVTVIRDSAVISAADRTFTLNAFETLLIPAVCGEYEVSLTHGASALLSHCSL